MRKFFKFVAAVFGVVVVAYYGSLAVEAFSAPSAPAGAQEFEQHFKQLDAIVDQQWSRVESIPTKDDLVAYQNLIDELGKFDFAPIEKKLARVRNLEAPARKTLESRMRAHYQTYITMVPYIGDPAAQMAAGIVRGPALAAAESYDQGVRNHVYRAFVMLHLRSNVRYHLAMAQILAGDDAAAVQQLKLVLKETPDYGLINATYIIGARAHAERDPDFLAALTAAGGSVERFQKDYVLGEKPVYIFPFFGNSRHDLR